MFNAARQLPCIVLSYMSNIRVIELQNHTKYVCICFSISMEWMNNWQFEKFFMLLSHRTRSLCIFDFFFPTFFSVLCLSLTPLQFEAWKSAAFCRCQKSNIANISFLINQRTVVNHNMVMMIIIIKSFSFLLCMSVIAYI